MTTIPLHELPESMHPVDMSATDFEDVVLDRYHAALAVGPDQRTNSDWAIIVAIHEAAPILADRDELTNYYSGDDKVPQLRPPVQGGTVSQS